MAKIVSIGLQDFEQIRSGDKFYVDKTNFIRDWWEQEDAVTLITRPRRFGKTLNMSMLEYFFANYHGNRGDLFDGLSIWKEEKYRTLQGTYPVIALSFAGVKADNYRDMKMQIFAVINRLYDKYPQLEKDSFFANMQELIGQEQRKGIVTDINDAALSMTLHTLTDKLYAYYGKKVLIFLDEYDTPMQEAWLFGYWDEIVNLFRNLFNNTFKTNPSMERAVITGITRVSKESIFSDLNNLDMITTTSNKYAAVFGFLESEVFDALEEQGLADCREDVKMWYDGFTFGTVTDIYNPWSIINYLDKGELTAYWANTSANGLVDSLICQGSVEVKEIMEDLLKGIPLVMELDEQITFNQLDKDEDAIWSLLLASGYLKVKEHRQDAQGLNEYTLELTNFEVKLMFEKLIRGWFKGQTKREYNEFIKALLKDDVEAMNHYMNRVALSTFSSFDTGKRPSEQSEPERFYHGFVLGLLVELKGDYQILSNRESGLGRYDIMLEPLKETLPAIVIEFKVFNGKKEQKLNDTVAAALLQIREKGYDRMLLDKGIKPEQIFHYGFAFEGKTVQIGTEE